MPLKLNCTKLTAASTTPGTDDSGNVQTITTLSGFTYKAAPLSDLWPGATSLGKLVQTSPETVCQIQLDSTASTFAAGYDYHRASIWMRCARLNNDSNFNTPPYIKMAATSVTTLPAFIPGERYIEKNAGTPTGVTGKIGMVGTLTAGAGNLYLTNDSGVYNYTTGALSSGTNLTAGNTILGLTSGATATLGAIAAAPGQNSTTLPSPAFPMLFDEFRTDAAFVYRFRCRMAFAKGWTPTAIVGADHSHLNGPLGGLCLYGEVPSGSAGPEITHNLQECGFVMNADGTGMSGGSQTPNFPIDEWMRLDGAMDRNLKRGWIGFNGFPMCFFSWTGANATDGTVAWRFSFPDWPGFQFELGAFSTWRELAGESSFADTGLTAMPAEGFGKAWGYSPSFAKEASSNLTKFAVGAGTGNTKLIRPLSLLSGNRPYRDVLEVTTNSVTNSIPVSLAAAPLRFGETGYAHLITRLQFGNDVGGATGNAWSGFLGFQGVASLVFDYSGGVYRLRDYAGTVIATWAKNARILLQLTVKGGRVWAMVSDRSKSWSGGATQTIFSKPVTLHPADVAPQDTDTTVSLSGSFTTTVSGDIFVQEAIEHYTEPVYLLGNSYTEAPLTGAGAVGTTVNSKVSDANAACRSTLNMPTLMQLGMMQADCNAHGRMVFPAGRQYQKWAIADTFGLSGCKVSDFWASNEAGFDHVRGVHILQWADDTNDLSAVSDLNTAGTVSTMLAELRGEMATKIIGNGGWYTWIEQPWNPNTTVVSPFSVTGALEAIMLTRSKTRTVFDSIRRNNPNGDRARILRVGGTNFDTPTSIHPGAAGTIQQFVHASAQLAGSRSNIPGVRKGGSFGAGLAAGRLISGDN